jgi:hypothetical protein
MGIEEEDQTDDGQELGLRRLWRDSGRVYVAQCWRLARALWFALGDRVKLTYLNAMAFHMLMRYDLIYKEGGYRVLDRTDYDEADMGEEPDHYIQFNRIIGQTAEGNHAYCIDRVIDGRTYGPLGTSSSMMLDVQQMFSMLLGEMPEYSSLRITFEILNKVESEDVPRP